MSHSSGAVLVLGGGGHAKVVVATLRAIGIPVAGLLDDDPALHGTWLLGTPVLGPLAKWRDQPDLGAVLALGDNRTRRQVRDRAIGDAPPVWVSAVHPDAVVHDSVHVSPGCVVFAGAVVQPDVRLGAHSIVNTGATIDHDCRIGDYAHVAPGANLAGGVEIGEGAFLGIGCAVVPGVRIGAWATVGAGSVVVRDVEPGATVKGVPAR